MKGFDNSTENASFIMNSLNDYKNDESSLKNCEIQTQPKKLIHAKHMSQNDVKDIQNKYKGNLGFMDEIKEDHKIVRYKGNFIIQKLNENNKIDLGVNSMNIRKNTSPNLKKPNSNQYRYLKSVGNKRTDFFDLNRLDEVICEENFPKKIKKQQLHKRNFDSSQVLEESLDSALIILKYSNEDKFGADKFKMYEAFTNGAQEKSNVERDNSSGASSGKSISRNVEKVRPKAPARNVEQNLSSISGCINAAKKRSWNKKLMSFAGIYKDLGIEEKFAYFHDFRHKIMLSNRLKVVDFGENMYRAYIGKGNNQILIKQALRKRWWWSQVEELDKTKDICTKGEINFVWTQKPKKHIQDNLPVGKENQNKLNMLLTIEKKRLKIVEEFQNMHAKILGQNDYQVIYSQQMERQASFFSLEQITYECDTSKFENVDNPNKLLLHNHVENGEQLGDKIHMFRNMKNYYESMGKNIYATVPLSFIVFNITDTSFVNFLEHFNELEKAKKDSCDSFKNLWIIKPGEDSNRGRGVEVLDKVCKIKEIIRSSAFATNGNQTKSFVIQKYIESPLLYKGRKFDIRMYMLVTWINGSIRAYWYTQGYVRTSSKEYSLVNFENKQIHLTNEAIQKKGEGYGKFESGNKLTLEELSKYIAEIQADSEDDIISFEKHIYPKIKDISIETIKSSYKKLTSRNSKYQFEIFGLDFMIDQIYQVWLIEVNTNPCLSCCSPVSCKLIPTMIENQLRLVLDPQFPPPKKAYKIKKPPPERVLEKNKFELVFSVD